MTPPIAICFFGITRSLARTLPSIQANILKPAEATPEGSKIYAHFFEQSQIDNPRSNEKGTLDVTEHRLLAPDALELEAPDTCLETWDFEGLKAYGNAWKDDFRSLRNLVHQLHSLDRVTDMAVRDGAQVFLFCRPDLAYHDSLSGPLEKARSATSDLVQLPWWQPFGGFNDRFAIIHGPEAARAYGQRIRLAKTYCAEQGPLHAERLLKFALTKGSIPVRTIGARATRTRVDGQTVQESFRFPAKVEFKRRFPGLSSVLLQIKSGLGARASGR